MMNDFAILQDLLGNSKKGIDVYFDYKDDIYLTIEIAYIGAFSAELSGDLMFATSLKSFKIHSVKKNETHTCVTQFWALETAS